MIDDELIERSARRHQHPDRHAAAAAGAADALPRRSDRSGITRQDRNIEASDIDPQFQRVGRNNTTDVAVSQSALDPAALVRKISAAIADDLRRFRIFGKRPFFDGLLQVLDQDLRDQPAVRKDDRRNIALQKGPGDVFGFLYIRAANAELLIDDRRIVEEHVLLAFAGATFANEFEWLSRYFFREFLRISNRG